MSGTDHRRQVFDCFYEAGNRRAVRDGREGGVGRPVLADDGGDLSQDNQVHTDHADHRVRLLRHGRGERRLAPVVDDVADAERDPVRRGCDQSSSMSPTPSVISTRN